MTKKPHRLTARELQVSYVSALILALRLFGLFAILPIFTIYALTIPGANMQNIGTTLGIYGLAAIITQPLVGFMSDRFGRLKIINVSLIVFIIGSLIAAFATSMPLMMIGRFLQGTGGIGSVVMAYIADHTRKEVRSKAMTTTSILISLSFVAAMILSPALVYVLRLPGLFAFTAFLGLLALAFTGFLPRRKYNNDTDLSFAPNKKMMSNKNILLIALSVFLLHVILLANFVILPLNLCKVLSIQMVKTWPLYAGSLVIASIIMLILAHIADSRKMHKHIIVFTILLMVLAEALFMTELNSTMLVFLGLILFFTSFVTLEAILPATLTRLVSPRNRGAALGFYVSLQFLGAFIGGWFGGYFGASTKQFFLYLLSLSVLWFLLVTSLASKEDLD